MKLLIVGPRLTGIVEDHLFRVEGPLEVDVWPRLRIREGKELVWESRGEVYLDGKRVRGLSRGEIEELVSVLRNRGWQESLHQAGTFGWALKALQSLREVIFQEVMLLGLLHKDFHLSAGKVRLRLLGSNVEEKRTNVALLPKDGVKVGNASFPQLIISSPKSSKLAQEEEEMVKELAPTVEGAVLLTMGSGLPPGDFLFSVYDPNRKVGSREVEGIFQRRRVVTVVNKLELANGSYPYPPEGSFLVLKGGSLQEGYDVFIFGHGEMVNLTLPVKKGIGSHHLGKGDRFSTFLAAKLAERRGLTIEGVRDSVVIAHDRLMEALESLAE